MPFFPQDLFLTLLCLERKRSERSGYPFGLALLDVARLPDAHPLCDALSSHMRATDITGWYRDPSIAGVIFNTLNGAPLPMVRSRLCAKIDTIVQGRAPYNLYIYPEDINDDLYPDLFISKPKSSFHAMKRVIDVASSLAVLTVFSPVFLGIAAAVKFSSKGPVLFRQKRLGLLGKEFDFWKFRTMYADNDPAIHRDYVTRLIQGKQSSSAVYKIQKDPRVTPIGRFLRKSSLDELPQFINVLKGEMSLVGPRPPIQYEMEQYHTWHKRRVLEVKPGITGLWQVRGRSRTTFDEMVRLDIRYIQEQSPWLDLVIVLQTPRAVLSGAGAY
jgi:lipopolysaccharide/colanic/teichoic acid biosynthesis glycosyltransferase